MKVVAWKCLPNRLPFWSTALIWLYLDRYRPPGWVYGAVGVVLATIWLVCIVATWKQEYVDIWEKK